MAMSTKPALATRTAVKKLFTGDITKKPIKHKMVPMRIKTSPTILCTDTTFSSYLITNFTPNKPAKKTMITTI